MSKYGKLAGRFLAAALAVALLVPVAAYADEAVSFGGQDISAGDQTHLDSWDSTPIACDVRSEDASVTLRAQELEELEAQASTVLVIGNVEWDDGNDREHKRPEKITVRLFANGTESQSLTFGVGESGQWLFTFDAVPILDNEGKKIVYTVSVDEIAAYTTDVAKVGDYAFGITNTLNVDPREKTTAIVAAAPEAGTLTYNGIWQALVSAGSTEDGKMMYALGTDSVTVPSKESFGARPSIGKNAGEYYVWYYVKGDAFHTDSAPVCVSATIGKLPATITVFNAAKNEREKDPVLNGSVEGLLDENDLGEVVYVRTSGEEAPGTYSGVLSAEYTENPNYDVSVVKGDFTITAIYYSVRFDPNVPANASAAYTGSMENQSIAPHEKKALTANGYSLPGYDFAGWNTKADGTGTPYADKAEVEGLTEVGSTITLYAQWSLKSFTVAFVNYDGSVLQSGQVAYGETPRYEGDTPAKPATAQYAYEFAGWSPKVVVVAGDATYTATYEATPVPKPAEKATLTFDLAGGTIDGTTGSITIKASVGDTIKLPAAPTREGYTFKYWKGSQYAAGADYKVEGDHSFTAVWEKSSTADSGKSSPLPATGDGNAVALALCTLMTLASLAFLSGSMIERAPSSFVKDNAGWFPVVSMTGPRQSGKSTLVQHDFPDYEYVNLEDEATRNLALADPAGFIRERPTQPSDADLAEAIALAWAKAGNLMHLVEEGEASGDELDTWIDLEGELCQRVLACDGITPCRDQGMMHAITPFMERNGYRDACGWWVRVEESADRDVEDGRCPACGAELEGFVEGSSMGSRCPTCGWSVATSYIPPIQEDEREYTIVLVPGGTATREALRAVSRIAMCNFVAARRLITGAPIELFTGCAAEVLTRKNSLKAAGVPIEVHPDFPYDEDGRLANGVRLNGLLLAEFPELKGKFEE